MSEERKEGFRLTRRQLLQAFVASIAAAATGAVLNTGKQVVSAAPSLEKSGELMLKKIKLEGGPVFPDTTFCTEVGCGYNTAEVECQTLSPVCDTRAWECYTAGCGGGTKWCEDSSIIGYGTCFSPTDLSCEPVTYHCMTPDPITFAGCR